MSILLINKLSKKFNIDKSLLKNLIHWFGVEETNKILIMKPVDIKNTIRVNMIKTTREEVIRRLKLEGIIVKTINSIPEALQVIKGWKKVGSSQSYLSGEIMPQGLGSMYAVHILDPKAGEKILDMAAAPGGKTCFIGERMRNQGLLIANDKSLKRISSLVNNLSRHSIENVIITNIDALRIEENNFDRILLDAPCSGEGLIVSKLSRRVNKTIQHNFDMQNVQKILLKRAISLLKIGGICVYSTCSLTPIENEEVLLSVLKKVKIMKISATEGEEGFTSLHPDFKFVKRFLPSKMKCDGFFIAKLKRVR